MSAPPLPPNDPTGIHALPAEAYARMTLVLRVGLGVALAIVGGGIVAYIVANPGATSSSVLSSNPILNYLSFPGLGSGLASGSIGAILTLGLIVLVATPIMRVVSGMYYFRKVGERAMAGITFAVLVMLLLGLLFIGPHVR